MKNEIMSFASRAILLICLFLLTPLNVRSQIDNPNVDNTVGLRPPDSSPVPHQNTINIITTPDGYDNFDLGVDFAEGHSSNNPRNPTWWFNCWNTNNTSNHHTENGVDWSSGNAPFPTNSGDPVSAYDSLGNLYWMTMNGPTITGTWVVKSTNNGQTWGAAVASNVGNDKNWLAADQTMGPYANYIYGTMTNSGTGSFTRSTDLGASFTQTWSFATQASPGMMVAVGPNVLGGNNISGGCVYVVTNSGAATSHTYTFYRSTNGGLSFDFMSAQSFAGYVGLFYNSRMSVEGVRTRPYPFIAADNSFGPFRGRLYLVHCTNNPAGNGNKPDLYCRYSLDQGVSWSSPVRINDDSNPEAHHQWMPAIWCDKETGRLYAKWFDSRNSANSDSTDVYASYSDDGGVTWAPNQRLTNRMFRTSCTTCGGGGDPRYQGDYTSISSNRQGALAVWMDYRNGNFMSMASYFPDFGMTVFPAADTLALTDSITVVVRVPSVKLYSRYVKFTASVSPPANFTLSFIGNRDSVTSYPDSVILKIKTNNVTQGVYAVSVTGRGPDGAAVHRRTISISALPSLVQVLQPNGGEQMFVGTSYPISWARNLVDTVKIEYSTNNGSSWILITPGVPSRPLSIVPPKLRGMNTDNPDESLVLAPYNWIVPNTPSTSCLVRVSDKLNPSVFDVSNSVFSIVAAPAARWTAQASGTTTDFYSVSVVDTSIAWAAGDSGRTYRTVNGGTSWQSRASVTNPALSISAVNASLALVASNAPNNARILRTNNGGLSFVTVYSDTSTGAYIDAVKMFDASNGFAVGDPVGGQWKLLRTSDGGATWFSAGSLAQAGSEYGWGNSMSWIGQNGWFGTNNSRVYRTTNGGTTWAPATTGFVNSFAVSFATDQLGMAAGNGAAYSTSGGTSWTNTPAPPPSSVFGMSSIDLSTDRWYLVAGTTVLRTTDRGTTFAVENSQANLYEAVDMKIAAAGGNTWLTGYAVGDNGTITKYVELLLPTEVEQGNMQLPQQFTLNQNYPNPFNPTTTITYELPAQSTVRLTVFDVLGREVRTLVNKVQPSGGYRVTWDGLSNGGTPAASGVYYYRFEASSVVGPGYATDKKMLLLK